MRVMGIYREIMHRFQFGKKLNDELVYSLWESIADRIVADRTKEEQEYYEQMHVKMNGILQYNQTEQFSHEQAFLYGGLWGSLNVLSLVMKKKGLRRKQRELVAKYKEDTAYSFLKSIYEIPGVQHKELAKICDVSAARISQIARGAEGEGLISAQAIGKEKYYYIREHGENVFGMVQKAKTSLASYKAPPDYKILFFTNQEIDRAKKIYDLLTMLDRNGEQYRYDIAVAVQNQQDGRLQSKEVFQINQEGNRYLCKHQMNNLYGNYTNFYESPKEIDITKLRSFIE